MSDVGGSAHRDASVLQEPERRLLELLARITYERLRNSASCQEARADETCVAEETAA